MKPWDVELVDRQSAGSLVQVARQGRLVREVDGKPYKVDLTWVDEAALALVDAAVSRGRSLALVYPAPASGIAALMAAEVAIGLLQIHRGNPKVGIATADPSGVTRVWNSLRVATTGDRVPLTEVFPVWRVGPVGKVTVTSGTGRRVFIGSVVDRWPVDVMVVDHLSGPVECETAATTIHVFADPLDAQIARLSDSGVLVWGWSDSLISLWHSDIETAAHGTVPFSVANERLAAMGKGVKLRIAVAEHPEAENAIEALRDDLSTLSATVGSNPQRDLLLGLRIAWGHALTLSCLPCRPSDYDLWAGLPPRAARATASFAPEIAAWARTLSGDAGEYSSMVATDLAELRALLDAGNPQLSTTLNELGRDRAWIAVLRTRTAARALVSAAGLDWDALTAAPDPRRVSPRMVWYSRLGREGNSARAVVVGAPSRSSWHKLDSGLASELDLVVLGQREARRVEHAAASVRFARESWASLANRERVWIALVDDPPPAPPLDVPLSPPEVDLQQGARYHQVSDPFSPLGRLLLDDRSLISEEGPGETVAREIDGAWMAAVDAIEVATDHGVILLALDQEVDVLEGVDEPNTCTAKELRVGMRLIVGREGGRVGLLEALEGSLRHRPDILASRMIARDYRERIHSAFAESGLTQTQVHADMRARGCTKTIQSVRTWLKPTGPLAPRDFPDLERLTRVLGIERGALWLTEVFAGVTRLRVFRRAAGKALVQAAAASVGAADETRVDPATGLSIADLRDAVVIATISGISDIPREVRVAEVGRLVQ